MRGVTYRAAHEGDDGDSAEFAQSALVGLDAYASIATSLVRAEGAIGVTWENILASHYRRAFWSRELLGGRVSERNRLLAAVRHTG